VPSCDLHNAEKSGDDEYLMAIFASKLGTNDVAFIHSCTKVHRAREIDKKLIKPCYEYEIPLGNTTLPVAIEKIDVPRLIRELDAIAHGLYFHTFKTQFIGRCVVLSEHFSSPIKHPSCGTEAQVCRMLSDKRKDWNTSIMGENPEIFQYQFSSSSINDMRCLYMNFYDYIEVFVTFEKGNRLIFHASRTILIMRQYKSIRNSIFVCTEDKTQNPLMYNKGTIPPSLSFSVHPRKNASKPALMRSGAATQPK
jgi:hypothetical protein